MESEENQSIAKFRQIPDPIRSFLLSEKVIAKRVEIRKKYDLGEKFLGLTRILHRVYDKEVPFSSLADLLVSEQAYAPAVAKEVALQIAGYEFLPISSYLGDVESYIRTLGGNPADYPAERIILKTYRPSEVVTEVLHEHPVSVSAFLEHRLREILESRVREVRKDAETVQRLTRTEKIGGVELPQPEAEALVQALNSKMRSVKIAADVEIAKPAVVPAPVAIPVKTEAPIIPQNPPYIKGDDKTSRAGHGVTAADEREAEEIRSKVLPKLIDSEFFDLDKEVQDSTEKVFAALGPKLPADLQQRFRSIIDARLRGVRDAAETGDLVTRPLSQGGLGLGQELADSILQELERRFAFIVSRKSEALNKEKESFVKSSVEAAYAKDEARKNAEQEDLDRMFGALTGKRKPVEAAFHPKPAEPVSPRPPSSPPSAPKLVVAVSAGAAPTTNNQQPAANNPYMYTPNSVVAPKIHDVRPVPSASTPQPTARLTGPMEELKNMTIVDFRRLSADPSEACRKITDKLDVLAEHSYARRIEGVIAWRESELYKKYLDIINASFSGGKPIQAIIAEEVAANRPSLTEREVHAIMDLNRQLKA